MDYKTLRWFLARHDVVYDWFAERAVVKRRRPPFATESPASAESPDTAQLAQDGTRPQSPPSGETRRRTGMRGTGDRQAGRRRKTESSDSSMNEGSGEG